MMEVTIRITGENAAKFRAEAQTVLNVLTGIVDAGVVEEVEPASTFDTELADGLNAINVARDAVYLAYDRCVARHSNPDTYAGHREAQRRIDTTASGTNVSIGNLHPNHFADIIEALAR